MLIDSSLVKKAKDKLGVENALWMRDILDLQQFDEHALKSLCPFHDEDTPSFIYNHKNNSFRCFGACARSYDVIDALMIKRGMTYAEAVKALLDKAGIQYSFGEVGVKTRSQYYYPKPIYADNCDEAYSYLNKRGLSNKTCEHLGLKQDENGNILIQYFDTNDVLTMVKVRPSRKVPHGETKIWCLKDASGRAYDTTPLLYNINKINCNEPLLICCGEFDCAAAIEAGYTNATSIPMGDGNLHWIDECFDWLEQFKEIIVCADNDDSGNKFIKSVIPRLGSWRCKIAKVPDTFTMPSGNQVAVKDLNEVLMRWGKEKVLDIIVNAKDSPVPSVVDFSDVEDIDLSDIDGIYTGFKGLDKEIMRLFFGSLTILSGTPGCVDADTEFFNGYGWKKISDYSPDDKVLQYNVDGTTSLVKPLKYHKHYCRAFYPLKTQTGINQMLSIDHNVVYVDDEGGINKIEMKDLIEKRSDFSGKIITSFKYTGKGIELDDSQIKLMTAVIANGTFSHAEKKSKQVRLNLLDVEQKKTLRLLLMETDTEWKEINYTNGMTTFVFEGLIRTNVYPKNWYDCSPHQFEIILEAAKYWNILNTKSKENADFLQFAMVSSGIGMVDMVKTTRTEPNFGGRIVQAPYYMPQLRTNVQMVDLINQDSYKAVDTGDGFNYCFTVPSGMLVLRRDDCINITGNSGKTSFLYQIACNCLDQGYDAWIFSRELPAYMSRNWMNYLFAGRRHINEYHGENDTVYYKVDPDAKKQIGDFYRGRMFFYRDDYSNNVADIQSSMVDSARKYGSKLFILDNLTTINLGGAEDAKYTKQTDFVNWLIQFSLQYSVAVILVCHPHKLLEVNNDVDMYDIGGSSNIINLAHRAIGLKRTTEQDRQGTPRKNGKGWLKPPVKTDVVVNVIKDRMRGRSGYKFGLWYDVSSRRFYSSPEEFDKHYKWDKSDYTDKLEYPVKDDEAEIFGDDNLDC